jgi:streptogramin lyase
VPRHVLGAKRMRTHAASLGLLLCVSACGQPDWTVLVADGIGSRVGRFTYPDGTFLGLFVADGVLPEGAVPTDIATGVHENTLVNDGSSDAVWQFDPTTGELLGQFIASGAGGVDSPGAPIMAPDGSLLIASRLTSEVLRFDATTGEYLGTLVQAGAGGLDRPSGMTIGLDGRLYVADHRADQVFMFDVETGSPLGAVNVGGINLDGCNDVLFLDDGAMIITARWSGVVVRVEPDGQAAVIAGPNGIFDGAGFAALGPDGALVIAAIDAGMVHRIDSVTGQHLSTVVSEGEGGLHTQVYSPAFVMQAPTTDPLIAPCVADAELSEKDPTLNFGTTDLVRASVHETSWLDGRDGRYRSLFQFDVPSLTSSERITDVWIEIYQADNNFYPGLLVAEGCSEPWEEHAVTWDSQPDRDGVIATAVNGSRQIVQFRGDGLSEAVLRAARGVEPFHGIMLRFENEFEQTGPGGPSLDNFASCENTLGLPAPVLLIELSDCTADLTGDGILDLTDVSAFIGGFILQADLSDLAEPFGVWDLADITTFIDAFIEGCP